MKKLLSVIFSFCLILQLFGALGVSAGGNTATATVVTGESVGVEGDSTTTPDGGDDEAQDELCITVDQVLTVEIVAEQITYIKFVPTASGIYTFTSLSDDDTYGFLYDADKNIIGEDDDDGEDFNFSITRELEGGKTYYWSAQFYSSYFGGSFDVTLTCDRIFCEHDNTTDHPAEDVTCTTDGYTAGTFCEDCQMWITGHERVPARHTDEDDDFLCDICGEDATEVIATGECGNALNWTLYSTGTLVITGEGEMWHWDFFNEYSPWTYHSALIRRVVIEEGVTSIGQNAFCSIDSYYEYDRHFYPLLTEIVIPNTVTTIHTNGISGTTALKTITLPSSATTLIGSAFNNNYGLQQYVVDENNPVFKAVDGVLFSKDGKTLVAYPIGSASESYTVPDGVDTIAAYAFSQCSSTLTEVIFNDELRFIDDEAFQNCDGLTRIELPNSLKNLGGGVFQECSNLSDIHLPRNITRIGGLAFDCTAYYNNWDNWEDNVLYIDGYLLDTIYRPEHLDWDEWKQKEGTLTVREGTTLIADEAVDSLEVNAVEFNNELQYIGFCSFGWLDITTVTLPSSLISLGDWAFYNCESLTHINMGDNLQYIGHDVFGETPYDNEENYVDGVLYYGPYALGFNDDLPDDVVLRDGTTIIAERAFWKEDGLLNTPDYGAPMESIAFPESLTTICDGAFYTCNNLKEVTIPATVTTIGHRAFGWIKGYDTSYDEETYEKMSDFSIRGYTDSAAHVYAVENDIPFIALDAQAPDGGEGGGSTTNPDDSEEGGTTTTPGGGDNFGGSGDIDGPTVTVKFPVSISITTLPSRLVFTVGEELDTTGLGVSILYDDSSVEPLYTYSILGYQSTVPGVQEITINHEGFTASYSVLVVAPSCTHQNVTVHEAVPSTCTTQGHDRYTTCDNCHEVISGSDAALPLLGHVYDNTNYDNESHWLECDCSHQIDREQHNWENATCTDPKTCGVCGDTVGEALGHDYADATCTDPKTCGVCGDTVGEALGHKSDSGTIIKAATCTATGTKVYKCTRCKVTVKTETIAKKAHSYLDATCTKAKTCKSCGVTSGKALGHNYDSGTVTKAATCKVTGIKTYTCKDCNATKTETIAKKAHNYLDATCTKAKTCKSCGVTSGKALGHKSDNGTITKAATCKATGTKTYKCTRCKVTVKTETIAKKSHTNTKVTTKATLNKDGKIETKCTKCGYVASKVTIKRPASFKLSTTTYTYNGKAKKPSVTVKDAAGKTISSSNYTVSYVGGCKNVGTYTVKVTMKGNYSGTKTLTFKVNPVKTSVSKLTASRKALKLTVAKKTTQVTGYQVQYSTSKSFKSYTAKWLTKNTTTSTTLSGLKAKTTYYVRVRTYKKVGSATYYSGWSTVKSEKTK